ncbi:MAG: hypothetical protein ACRCXZ_09055 [Patescibacteria group bacterium]
MPLISEKELWSQKMETYDKIFYTALKDNSSSFFENIRVVKLSDLKKSLGFSDPTMDPRDILCFVEKCVDERFIYNRSLPEEALKNPVVKYNYRQAIADFGVPGVGCLYSPQESKRIADKISSYLIKNKIPVFISEAHEGCGAVMAKCRTRLSNTDQLFVKATAQKEAESVAKMVENLVEEKGGEVAIFKNYATIQDYCYRVKDEADNECIANIHNGTGLIVLPNFFDKDAYSKVFLPDKFCLINNICMFNIVDSGEEFDFNIHDDLNPNSTAEYIVFCIKIMLGQNGLGEDFFLSHNPIQIIAACDTNLSTDVLRAYKLIKQVNRILSKDYNIEKLRQLFDFILLEY